jgi:hypothetical protein
VWVADEEPPVEFFPPVAEKVLPPDPLDPPVAALAVVPPVAGDPPVAFIPPVVPAPPVALVVETLECPPVAGMRLVVPPVVDSPPVLEVVVAHVFPPVACAVVVMLEDPPVAIGSLVLSMVEVPAAAGSDTAELSKASPLQAVTINTNAIDKSLVVMVFSFYLSYSRNCSVLACYARRKHNGCFRPTGISPRTIASL